MLCLSGKETPAFGGWFKYLLKEQHFKSDPFPHLLRDLHLLSEPCLQAEKSRQEFRVCRSVLLANWVRSSPEELEEWCRSVRGLAQAALITPRQSLGRVSCSVRMEGWRNCVSGDFG